MSMENAKKAAAFKALEFLEKKMILGLGSGTTAAFFIDALIAKKNELDCVVVSSSKESEKKALSGGLQVKKLEEVSHVDITVDGADEIDTQKRMIKGGGGAHVREKILAASSQEMIVIIDETKWVENLGKTKLPVEVLFFGHLQTKKKIEEKNLQGSFRKQQDGSLFVTDNGNVIYDITFASPIHNPEEIHTLLKNIPGVVDTGFFFSLAGRVITGYENGEVKVST